MNDSIIRSIAAGSSALLVSDANAVLFAEGQLNIRINAIRTNIFFIDLLLPAHNNLFPYDMPENKRYECHMSAAFLYIVGAGLL